MWSRKNVLMKHFINGLKIATWKLSIYPLPKKFYKRFIKSPCVKTLWWPEQTVLFYQTRFLSDRNPLKRAATKDMGFINLLLNYVLCRSPEDDTKNKNIETHWKMPPQVFNLYIWGYIYTFTLHVKYRQNKTEKQNYIIAR